MEGKILILGAKGMLGRELAEVFADQNPVLWDREDINIADKKDVAEKVSAFKPAVIINAAAYTDVDGCETNRELALAVNGYGVGYLAEAARGAGAVLAHYSTDYVFDGKNPRGYPEDARPENPVNFYGESKLLGEKLLGEEGAHGLRYYLIRTSWLFGRHGKNFASTMLKLAETKTELSIVDDQHGKPTYAKDLADATRKLLGESYPSGVYHVVNEPETTWYRFASAIFDTCSQIRADFRKPVLKPCASAEFPRPAKRPAYSALLNTKLPLLRNWQGALDEYLNTMVGLAVH